MEDPLGSAELQDALKVASERDRLREINAELLAALKACVAHDGSKGRVGPLHRAAQNTTPRNMARAAEAQRIVDLARAAIAKAEADG